MIDTPGTNSKNECMKHALLLRHALTVYPLNAIFVIIEF